jgi:hypothetical protein
MQVWWKYFSSNSKEDVYFDGLSRGQSYAMTCVVSTTETLASSRRTQNFTVKSTGTGNATSDLIPVPVDATVCLSLTFTIDPSADLRKAILGFCQNTFSAGAAKPILTGCVVCQDDKQTSIAGSELPKNTTCPTAASRLRSLATPAPTPATPVVPVTPPAPVPTFVYSVCAVPSVTCKDNVVAVRRRLRDLSTSTGLANVLTNSVKNALADSATLIKTLNLAANANIGLTNVGIVSDATAPVIVLSASGAQSNDNTGKFSTVVNFNGTASYQCYYQVLSGTTAPTAANIKACTNTSSCGSFILLAPSVTVSNTVSPAFTIGNDYTVFAACYNRVPGAQNASSILTLYTFKPVCPTGQSVVNGICATPTPPVPVPAPTSSNYIFMSIASIVAMIFILFN